MYFFKFSCLWERIRTLNQIILLLKVKCLLSHSGVFCWHCSWANLIHSRLDAFVKNSFTLPIPWRGELVSKPCWQLICFNISTERRQVLRYAKALIGISSGQLSSRIPVSFAEGRVVYIDVTYQWKLFICDLCQSFGHVNSSCPHFATGLDSLPFRCWKVKAPQSKSLDPPVSVPSFDSLVCPASPLPDPLVC